MNTGKETWKWGVVVLLLAVFLITANQAYQHIANQEDFEAPDDYLKGDSWDLEHGGGPGAGQPIQISNDYNRSQTTPAPVGTSNSNSGLNSGSSNQEPIILEDNVNWNQSDSDSNQAPKAADSAVKSPKPADNSQSGMYEIFSTPSVNENNTSASEEKVKESPVSNNTESKQEAVPEPVKPEVPAEEKTSEAIPTETPTASPAETKAEAPTEAPASVPAEAPTVVPNEVPAQPANEAKTVSEPTADVPAAQ